MSEKSTFEQDSVYLASRVTSAVLKARLGLLVNIASSLFVVTTRYLTFLAVHCNLGCTGVRRIELEFGTGPGELVFRELTVSKAKSRWCGNSCYTAILIRAGD